VDEAAAKLQLEADSLPEDLDLLERRVQQLKIEREALMKEEGDKARARLGEVETELGGIEVQRVELRQRWEKEKNAVNELRGIRKGIDAAKVEEAKAVREGNLAKAAELKYGAIPQLERELEKAHGELAAIKNGSRLIKEEVDEEDIAGVVARWTNIPVSRMLQSEAEKLANMEEALRRRVVGQDTAVAAVSNAIRRSRAGLQDERRPIGAFLFLGPTGVGKTELARALAEYLFGDERAIVRLDMSEYMEKHTVSKIIGAPPGYVGFDEAGGLTEQVRRKPYAVLLFDEVEKAHPDVLNVLLQTMDEGRLTDGHGRVVDFKNTILVMTSNLGSEYLKRTSIGYAVGKDGDTEAGLQGDVLGEVRKFFRPEFVNRLDDIVVFNILTKDNLLKIVDLQLDLLAKSVSGRGFALKVTDPLKRALAEDGYDQAFGARPLKRKIQQVLVNPLALGVMKGEFKEGDTVLADYRDGGYVLLKT